MLPPNAAEDFGQSAHVRRRCRTADPADDRLAHRAIVRAGIRRGDEPGRVDARRDDRHRIGEPSRVSSQVLVARNHVIAVADDCRHLARRLQRTDEPVCVAHARQEDGIVEIEDDGRAAAERQ